MRKLVAIGGIVGISSFGILLYKKYIQEPDPPDYKILFSNPKKCILEKERNFKLLKPSSEFYMFLHMKKQQLIEKYGDQIFNRDLNFSVQLVNEDERWSEELVSKRCKELNGKIVTVDNASFVLDDRKIFIRLPSISEFGEPSVMLAEFKEDIPNDIFEVLL